VRIVYTAETGGWRGSGFKSFSWPDAIERAAEIFAVHWLNQRIRQTDGVANGIFSDPTEKLKT
jgi:hypothetical protein